MASDSSFGNLLNPTPAPTSTTPAAASTQTSGLGALTTPSTANPYAGYGDAASAAYDQALQTANAAGLNFSGMSEQAAQQAAYAAMTPAQQAQYQQTLASNNDQGGFWGFVNKYAPYAILAVGAAATGGAVSGAIGGLGGAVAGGATTGAISTAGSDVVQGKPLTAGSVAGGALMGGVGGGLGYEAAPAASALNNSTGIGSTASNALVKGGIGAATGALGGKLTGGNVGDAALVGGATGAISGAVSSATGSNAAGKAAAGLGTMAISPLLGGGNTAISGVGTTGGTTSASGTSSNASGAGGANVGTMLGGLLQGAAGVYGSQNYAEDETKGINNAITEQNNTLSNINGIYGQQQATGNQAFGALSSLEGGNGSPANYSNFINSPGYQFAVNQGTQAIQRQAAATGQGYTPNTMDAVGQYVTGTASQNYNNYVSQLLNTAQFGSSANQNLAQANTTVGSNISQLMQNAGVAQATGVAGAAGAVGSTLGSLTGGLTSLFGGGSTSSYNAANGPVTGSAGTGLYDQGATTGSNAIPSYDASGVTAPTMPSIEGDTGTGDMYDYLGIGG